MNFDENADVETTTARRGGRPSREESEQLRDRILDAAQGLFLVNGYEGTSVDAIAARAGITKRTLYHRFTNKTDLFEQLLVRLVESRMQHLGAASLDGDIEEMLLALAHEIVTVATSEDTAALHRLMVAEAPRFPEVAESLYRNITLYIGEVLGKLFQHEIDRGVLEFPDPKALGLLFLQSVVSEPLRYASIGQKWRFSAEETDTRLRHIVHIFLNGCRPRA